jgi:hypothetical protein
MSLLSVERSSSAGSAPLTRSAAGVRDSWLPEYSNFFTILLPRLVVSMTKLNFVADHRISFILMKQIFFKCIGNP